MANTGYSNLSLQPSSTLRAAPPLGHIPPPPPSKPPPYCPFLSGTQTLEYSSQYSTTYEQYTSLYQQTHTTPTTQVPDTHQSPSGCTAHDASDKTVTSLPISKTVGEVSSLSSTSSHSSDGSSSRTSKVDANLPLTETIDSTEGKQESSPPDESAVAKYKSDEGLKMKFSGGFASKKRPNPSIAVQLKPQTGFIKKSKVESAKFSVAQAFGSDSDEEATEEMPRAAKLRMRNIGKDTPTSAGPNSFNKTSKGFTDQAAVFKKQFGM